MCVGENCARQAASYVKAQLSTLYKNAVDCLQLHDPYQKPADKSRSSHALREFTYYSSRRKPLLQVTFGEPRLEFICNHDVTLHLNIETATFILDDSKSVAVASGKDRVQVENVTLAFRVPFCTRRLDATELKYNNGQNPLQLIILDYAKADLVSGASSISVGREALTRYLKEYLLFLAEAGNHVFFSIPCSDDDRYRLTIDYSTMEETRTRVELGELYGIGTDKINEYLSSAWLKAKLALGGTAAADWKTCCLAEYRSTSGPASVWDVFFHVRMHPPRLQPLCSQEAILYFNVDEVLFYEDADFTKQPRQTFHDWQIAVVADVVHEEKSEGCVTRCTLDLSTARPAPIYCTHAAFAEDDVLAETYWIRIVDFFSSTYLQILESAGLHVVYYFDTRWPTAPQSSTAAEEEEIDDEAFFDAEDSSKAASPAIIAWKDKVKDSSMSGFDRVIVTAQSALNKFFGSLWSRGQPKKHQDHSLVEWKYMDDFEARLQPFTLRLLSSGRAIVWVHLEEGSFRLLESEQPSAQSAKYQFDGWHLAFEVSLKKIVHSPELEASPAWIARFKDSLIFKEHGNRTDRTLEYIVLDLEDDVDFLFEYSSFEGLLHQADHSRLNSSANQVLAVVHYLKNYYFVELARSGLNILQAIPVRKPGADAAGTHVSVTTVEFDVCAPGAVTRDNWAHASGGAEPVVAVVGMTDFRALPRAGRLEYTPGLTTRAPGGAAAYGTVCLARAAFLDTCVLDVLSGINARTTLIPLFSGVVGGAFELCLSTWAENQWKAMQKCGWEEAYEEAAGVMEYRWIRHDYWDTGETNRFNYTVDCRTCNVVQLPIASRTKCLDIKVSGETSLAVDFKSAAQQESSQAAARWNATISIRTGPDGLSIQDIAPVRPRIEPAPAPAPAPCADKPALLPDLRSKLQERLPAAIDFGDVLGRLRAFEGPWKEGYVGMHACALAHPVFTRAGDALFELRPQAEGAASLRALGGCGGAGSGQASFAWSAGTQKVESEAAVTNGLNGAGQSHIDPVEDQSRVVEEAEQAKEDAGDRTEAGGAAGGERASDDNRKETPSGHDDGTTTEEEY